MQIAITGNIGSGKTTVCKMLESRGFPTYYADEEIKKFAYKPEIKERLIKTFGNSAFSEGVYNTKYISSVVFGYPEEMEKLNSILFSNLVIPEFEKFAAKYPVSIFESALVFEHELQENFDYVMGVYCNQEETLKRLKARNGYSEAESLKRINSQMDSQIKMTKCDFFIDTTFVNPDIEKLIRDLSMYRKAIIKDDFNL